MTRLYVWVIAGRPVPPGYRPDGAVSFWPGTTDVRSRLYVLEVNE